MFDMRFKMSRKITDFDGLVDVLEEHQRLVQACKGLLREIYVGEGKILCPPALVEHIRAIVSALAEE